MKYFTISEMIHSETAVARRIWNGADGESERNLTALIEDVLDPAYEAYRVRLTAEKASGKQFSGKLIRVNSGFRTRELNSIIHGASQSQHLRGEAADLTTEGGPQGNLELARIIVALGKFDQLILENVPGTSLLPAWVHVSWKRNGRNRGEVRKKVARSSQYPLLTAYELKGLMVNCSRLVVNG